MLELRKKGNKHWLLIDEEIGEFTPSKFTINRLNNVINIVYFNNLKSKEYNVSDCYIFDIDDTSGFNTSNGVAFMDKLEELNCPCFQKDVNNFYISGGSWSELTDFDSLPDADLPLLGTEQIAIIQDGETKKLDLSTKLDKVSTSGVERAYIINADGSQGTKATSEIGTTQNYFTFSTNTTLSNAHHNAVVWVTATINITIPSGLRSDFNCTFRTLTGAIATFLTSGTTINAESDGDVQAAKTMSFLAQYTTNNYIISGGGLS